MKTEDRDRNDTLRRLLGLSAPLRELADDFAMFPFDYEGAGVNLTSTHLEQILRRYIQGEIAKADVEAWANVVEGRDDIHITSDEIESVLHELANPCLTHPLETERARLLLDKLAQRDAG